MAGEHACPDGCVVAGSVCVHVCMFVCMYMVTCLHEYVCSEKIRGRGVGASSW